MKVKIVLKGGEGSGHFGHAGLPGKHGGSAPGSGGSSGSGGDSGSRKTSTEPAKQVAQNIRKGWSGYKLSKGGDNEQASLFRNEKGLSASKIERDLKQINSTLTGQGYKVFTNPQKTDNFRNTGGVSYIKDSTVIDVSTNPSSGRGEYGTVNVNITRFDLLNRNIRIPID